MPHFVEFVTYSVEAASEDQFLALRSAAIVAVKAAHPALVSVPVLAKRPDGSWTDVWIYQTKEAADAANAGADDIPEFVAFSALVDGVEIETGSMPDGAVSPL
jgi:hypothetical protein